MQLDEGMDTGPVFLRKVVPLDVGETAGSLFDRLAPLGASALLEALEGIEAGTLVAEPQDESLASHAPMLRKSDGEVNWDQPAEVVVNRICGLDPWPGSSTTCDGKPLKLYGARLEEGEGKPGEILACDATGMVIACAQGACRILDVQPAGKRRMAAHDFACGRRIERGNCLGVDEGS
jgi:methionyl-tRNA formyltransferase